VLEAGNRVILPDLPGFGRSDKPMDEDWYSYDRHTAAIADLLETLDLRDATLVLHDWGGPIGLRIAVEQPERVARLVVMDTGLFTGRQPMSEAWHRFARFVDDVDELPVGFLVRRGCFSDPGDEVAAAYDAPFPSEAAKAGARAFPAILPLRPEDPGAAVGERTLRALQSDTRPMLMLWGAEDRPLPPAAGEAFASALGQPAPRRVEGAGHYLQEDRGDEVGRLIADWLAM
jgi:haloalkane dehalogenase